MPRPLLMSHADWLTRTNVAKTIGSGDKKRSQTLTNVDAYLQAYHTSDQWPQMLRQLEVVLDDWIRLKTKSNGDLKTMRSHTTVQELQRQVKDARKLPDPVPWEPEQFTGIYVAQDPFAGDFPVPEDFRTQVDKDLRKLIGKTRGKQLVTMISDGCINKNHRVVIQYNKGAGGNQCAPVNVAITNEFRRGLSEPGGVNVSALLTNPEIVSTGISTLGGAPEFIPNSGANVVVKYNHLDSGEEARESFIGLAHELIHAYHFIYGLCARSPTGGAMGDHGGAEEEMRTVGALAYKDEVPSENWIRGEWGMTLRTKYSGYDFKDTKATLFVAK